LAEKPRFWVPQRFQRRDESWKGTASKAAEKLTNAWNTVEERRFSAA
jgi:hypothetical protein